MRRDDMLHGKEVLQRTWILRKHLADTAGRLLVCGLTGAVFDVFTMTRMVSSSGALDAPFEMAPDRETAVSRLA